MLVDEEGYENICRSRKNVHAVISPGVQAKEIKLAESRKVFKSIHSENGDTRFCGYVQISSNTKVIALFNDNGLTDELTAGEEGIIIIEETPFYAEKGGQKGDTGTIKGNDGSNTIARVCDTQMPVEGLTVHYIRVENGSLHKHQQVIAQIDDMERIAIAANHTATHLLHYALLEVLGSHIKQAGSSVTSSQLRFDFTHNSPLKRDEIDRIEELINQKISENHLITSEITDFSTAQEKGAIALFGEKYGERVRIVDIGGFSKELCGGTHLDQTFRIGIFKIVSEQGIGSGVRRIEAVTREKAWQFIKKEEDALFELMHRLEVPQERLLQKVDILLEENALLKRDYRQLWKNTLPYRLEKVLLEKKQINGINVISAIIDTTDKTELRTAGDLIKEKAGSGIIILASQLKDDRIMLIVVVSDDLINRGYDAGELIRPLAESLNGQGGGKKHFAQAGGTGHAVLQNMFSDIGKYLEL